jgi:HPt (histidine-containing phosphotransfer) domain-containing protein
MNFQKLSQEVDIEEDEYRELFELFIEKSISDIKELKTALDNSNKAKASDVAHSLRGAALNLGLYEIIDLLEALSSSIKSDREKDTMAFFCALDDKINSWLNLVD